MKKLQFDYFMEIRYTIPAKECHFTIKCMPYTTNRQKISDLKIELLPDNGYTRDNDSFGNQQIYGCVSKPHRAFSFHITGNADVGLSDFEQTESGGIFPVFRYPHGMNCAQDNLKAYFKSLESSLPQAGGYERGVALMHALYRDFHYEKNCTDMNTTAEEAWTLGKGVCQDYAHILIALCHLAGIPARYVTGMLIGEGYSHAWVEIYDGGCWYGLDPTNDLRVTDSHIRIGCGRDALDCMINRGVMLGGGTQTQSIRVNVSEILD